MIIIKQKKKRINSLLFYVIIYIGGYMEICYPKNEKDIDELVEFFDGVFSEFTIINESTSLGHKELMISQFNEDPKFIMYIKDNNKIIAGLFSFYSEATNNVTLSLLGVLKEYRHNSYGSKLIKELIKKSSEKNCDKIILTSKTINYDFYIKNGFKPILDFVVFKNVSKEEFERNNKYKFELYNYKTHEYMMDGNKKVSTRVEYIVDYPKMEYLDYYNNLYSSAGYYFVKELPQKRRLM